MLVICRFDDGIDGRYAFEILNQSSRAGRKRLSRSGFPTRPLLLAAATLFMENVFYVSVLPLLPEYAQDFGLSSVGVGIIVGTYSAGIIAGSYPAAWVARRLGYRKVAALGLFVLALSTATFGFATEVAGLYGARFIQGVGGAFAWIGALGWVISLTSSDRRGLVIGSVMSAAVVGAVIGPAVGGLAILGGPELVFGLLAVAQIGLGLGIVATATVNEDAPQPVDPARSIPPSLGTVAFAMCLVALPSLLAGAYEVMTPLRLDAAGASAAVITTVFVVGAALEVVVGPLTGRISDRSGRLPPLRVGLLVAPALCLLFTVVGKDMVLLVLLAVGAWLAIAAAWTPALALVADLAASGTDATTQHWALLNVVLAGGVLLGSVLGPFVAQAWGSASPYLLVGAACVWAIIESSRATRIEKIAIAASPP